MTCKTEQIIFNFSSDEEYLFVNFCLNMLYNKLPSYCYYFDNSELDNFWNNLSDEEVKMIYDYLCSKNQICSRNNYTNNRKGVMDFVNGYFN